MKAITIEEKIIEILKRHNEKNGIFIIYPVGVAKEINKLYKSTLCTCPPDKQRIEKINCCNTCGKLIEEL